MKTIIKILVSSLSATFIISTFFLTLKNSTLESLKSNAKQLPAGNKCCPSATRDCMSVSTGTIYPGMRDC